MPTIAESLGAYAAALRYEDLPAGVVHQAKRTMMDTLACGLGGYDCEPVRIARELASLVNSSAPATLFVSGAKTTMEMAAFANDVMVRYLDFNDGDISKGGGHPSDSIAALIAAAETAHADGRALLQATVLAYEVYGRFSDALEYKAIGVDHATIGGLASAVGAAKLLGLSETQMVQVVNLYVAGNVALNQTRIGNLSAWKACAYANANRNAIFAVQLAARGMSGPESVFEGRNGFFKVTGGTPFELATWGGGAEPFRILRTHFKQFALCNFAQTMVGAILELRPKLGDLADVAQVRVGVSQKAMDIMADDPGKWRPDNRETADHSIPYTAALAVKFGAIEPRHFDEEYLRDESLLDIAQRVECYPHEEATRRDAEVSLCELEIKLRSGERLTSRVDYHRGHWKNPMTDAEVADKLRSLARPVLPAAQVEALIEQIWALERMSDTSALVNLMVRH